MTAIQDPLHTGAGVLEPAVKRKPRTAGERARQILARSPVHLTLWAIAVVWLAPTIGLLITSLRPSRRSSAPAGGRCVVPAALHARELPGGAHLAGPVRRLPEQPPDHDPGDHLPAAVRGGGRVRAGLDPLPLPGHGLAADHHPDDGAGADRLHPAGRILGNAGLTKGFVAVWLAHAAFALPFGIFLLRNFFITLPASLLEAARIDGATEWKIFRSIVIPLSVPAIASLGIFQFLWVWNDLLMALVFIQNPAANPMTRQIQSLLSQYGTEWHLLAAGAFILMIVPLVVFFGLQRFFVQGLLAGGVK
jgi:alpha-glucoside transport system permease protein